MWQREDERMGYRKIAKVFDLDVSTIKNIVKRERERKRGVELLTKGG